MNIEQIAQVCHETNRAYCITIGDHSQSSWAEAEEWQRESARKGVQFALDYPNAAPSAQHDAWLADKQADGWTYGPVKDPGKKEHPCIISYENLPVEQRIKDYLFRAVVQSFVEGGR